MKQLVLSIAVSAAALVGAAALPQAAAAQVDVGTVCDSLIGSDSQTLTTPLVRLTVDTCKNADVAPPCTQNPSVTEVGGLATIRIGSCLR